MSAGSASRRRIAFLTSTDARSKAAWSGIHYYMAQALQRVVGDVVFLGPVDQRLRLGLGKGLSFVSRILTGRRVGYAHRASLSRAYAREFASRLSGVRADVIVAPAGSTEIAQLETQVPIVYLSDTTFALLVEYYRPFTNLWPESKRQGHDIERRAIARSALALFPSRWAAESAVREYGADPVKVHVIPFGANIDGLPDGTRARNRRVSGRCRMLLVGIDWHRKGADIALEAMIALRGRGVDAHLTVCGCTPPRGVRHPGLTVIPFVDKSDAGQYRRFQELFWDADVFIMPTRADCYGIVFCEAGAYGLPSFATNTGGVSGVVQEGVNGFLLPAGASGAQYAERIAALMADEARYRALAASSRQLVETRLNWDAWAASVRALLSTL